MITSLTASERTFLAHYGWELFHGIYEAEADSSLYAVRPEEELVIPWTPEELRARNAELAPEVEALKKASNA